LNDGPPLHNQIARQQLTNPDSSLSAHCQQIGSTASQTLAPSDAVLRQIVEVWPGLSGEIRSLVEALCLQPPLCDSRQRQRAVGNAELAEIVTSWAELSVRVKLALISVVRSCLEDSQSLERGKE
jgi:hypothetical protein